MSAGDLTPLPYQQAGVAWLYDHPRSLLADEAGLGKTIQTCVLLGRLFERNELGRALIVVPAHLVPQWREELAAWAPSILVHDSTEKVISNPRPDERADYLRRFPQGPDVLLVSYEFTSRRIDYLGRLPFDTVILDEAAKIKNGGKEHRAVTQITARARRVHALTATPFELDATETFNILAAVGSPGLWPRGEFNRRFVTWSAAYRNRYGQRIPPSPTGLVHEELPALRTYLSKVCLRRTAEEVGLELPTHVGPRVMWVPLLPGQRAAIDAARRSGKTAIALHHEQEQSVGVVDGRSSKAEAALDYILARPDEPKFIVWAERLEHLDVMAELLDRHGISWTRIDGPKSEAQRAEAMRSFRAQDGCRVLLGSEAIGIGLNAQHCRVLLSLGSTYNPGTEAQREGRIRRIGSPHATYEHVTFLNETEHEERRAGTLTRRAGDADAVIGRQQGDSEAGADAATYSAKSPPSPAAARLTNY